MTYHAKVISGGKIVIPAKLRRMMGIADGDTIVLEEESDGRVVLKTYRQVVREIQDEFRKYQRPGISAVDELIAERRAEAAREEEEARQWWEKHGGSDVAS